LVNHWGLDIQEEGELQDYIESNGYVLSELLLETLELLRSQWLEDVRAGHWRPEAQA
jgi:hypothetical protein